MFGETSFAFSFIFFFLPVSLSLSLFLCFRNDSIPPRRFSRRIFPEQNLSVFRSIRLRKRLCLLPTKVIVKINEIALGVDIRAQIVHAVTPIFIRDKENRCWTENKTYLCFFFFFLDVQILRLWTSAGHICLSYCRRYKENEVAVKIYCTQNCLVYIL